MSGRFARACMKVGMIAGICIMAYAGWGIYAQLQEDLQSDASYGKLKNAALLQPAQDADTIVVEAAESPEAAAAQAPKPAAYPPIPEGIRDIRIDFAALQAVNPEIIAWIYCPDTPVDYPVVRGTDNQHYLHYLYDGTRNANGTIFLDYETNPSFSDTNNVLYGHHMRSGKMFAVLEKYKAADFVQTHPYFYLFTPRGVYEVELFAGVVKGARKSVPYPNFESDEAFTAAVEGLRAASTFQKDVALKSTDRLLWMITCDYDFNNARYFLVGRLNKIGEWQDEAADGQKVE